MYISEIISSVYTNKFNMQLLFVCVCVYVLLWLQFMEQENSTPLVQFWLTADSFRSQLSDPQRVPNIERDTTDAITIYERCDSHDSVYSYNWLSTFLWYHEIWIISMQHIWMDASKQPCTCMSCILSLIVIMHGITLCMHTLKDDHTMLLPWIPYIHMYIIIHR